MSSLTGKEKSIKHGWLHFSKLQIKTMSSTKPYPKVKTAGVLPQHIAGSQARIVP